MTHREIFQLSQLPIALTVGLAAVDQRAQRSTGPLRGECYIGRGEQSQEKQIIKEV